MAAHRYWRIYITAVNGTNATGITQITMATSLGGADQCSGGTAAASSVFASPTYDASKAFDANATTFWASAAGSFPMWISYDFGSGNDKDILQFTIESRPDGSSTSQTPVTGSLQYSDDNSTWFDLFNFYGITAPGANVTQTFNAAPAGAHWEQFFKSSSALINGSTYLTVTASGAAAGAAVGKPCTGLTYFQITIGSAIATSQQVGLAGAFFFLFGNTVLGNDTSAPPHSIGYNNSGTVRIANATVATIQTFAANDVIDVAFNPIRKLIWFRKNNGNWNNDVIGNQNPDGNVGGISTASLGSNLFPAWSAGATGNNATGVFSSGFTYTAPTGYITVDTNQLVDFVNTAVGETDTFTSISSGASGAAVTSPANDNHSILYSITPAAAAASAGPRSVGYS